MSTIGGVQVRPLPLATVILAPTSMGNMQQKLAKRSVNMDFEVPMSMSIPTTGEQGLPPPPRRDFSGFEVERKAGKSMHTSCASSGDVPQQVSKSQPVVLMEDIRSSVPGMPNAEPDVKHDQEDDSDEDLKQYFYIDNGRIFCSQVVLERLEKIVVPVSTSTSFDGFPSSASTNDDIDHSPAQDADSSSESAPEDPRVRRDSTIRQHKKENHSDAVVIKDTDTQPGTSSGPLPTIIRPRRFSARMEFLPVSSTNGQKPDCSDSDSDSYTNPYLSMAPRCSMKEELKALYDTKNPRPSTSRALRREMAKVRRTAARREKMRLDFEKSNPNPQSSNTDDDIGPSDDRALAFYKRATRSTEKSSNGSLSQLPGELGNNESCFKDSNVTSVSNSNNPHKDSTDKAVQLLKNVKRNLGDDFEAAAKRSKVTDQLPAENQQGRLDFSVEVDMNKNSSSKLVGPKKKILKPKPKTNKRTLPENEAQNYTNENLANATPETNDLSYISSATGTVDNKLLLSDESDGIAAAESAGTDSVEPAEMEDTNTDKSIDVGQVVPTTEQNKNIKIYNILKKLNYKPVVLINVDEFERELQKQAKPLSKQAKPLSKQAKPLSKQGMPVLEREAHRVKTWTTSHQTDRAPKMPTLKCEESRGCGRDDKNGVMLKKKYGCLQEVSVVLTRLDEQILSHNNNNHSEKLYQVSAKIESNVSTNGSYDESSDESVSHGSLGFRRSGRPSKLPTKFEDYIEI